MVFLLGFLLPDQHTSKKCLGCKDDLESHKNATLGITFLRITVKRSKEKKQQQETEKQQYAIVLENSLFKDFTTKGVQNYDQK